MGGVVDGLVGLELEGVVIGLLVPGDGGDVNGLAELRLGGVVEEVVGLAAGGFIAVVIGFTGTDSGVVDCAVADFGVIGLVNGMLELESVEDVVDKDSCADGKTSVFEGFLEDLAPCV